MKRGIQFPYATQYKADAADVWRWDCNVTTREAAFERGQALLDEGRTSARVLWDVTAVADAEIDAQLAARPAPPTFVVVPILEDGDNTCGSLATAREYLQVRADLKLFGRKIYLEVRTLPD